MQNSAASLSGSHESRLPRRHLLSAAAWTVPVLATAAAAPLSAASGSPDINVGDFANRGSCGVLGVQGPGFQVTAAPDAPLPVGTTLLVIGSGVGNIGQFTVLGVLATVVTLSNTARLITLTAALPAGAAFSARSTLSISTAFTLTGVISLPNGYAQGSDAKPGGSVSSTLILCSAS